MAEQVPAVETPEVAEAQAPEVDQHQDLRNKLNRLADYVEIGAWALQSLVILDDIDDAYENKPYLLQDMNISKQDMENTLAFIRTLRDHAGQARDVVHAEVNDLLQLPRPAANNRAPADLHAPDSEQ